MRIIWGQFSEKKLKLERALKSDRTYVINSNNYLTSIGSSIIKIYSIKLLAPNTSISKSPLARALESVTL